MNYSFYFISL